MNYLSPIPANHRNCGLETRVGTVVSMEVANIGPLVVKVENKQNLPAQFTDSESESD